MNRKKNTRAVAALLCGALLALVLLSGCSASAEPVKAQGKSYFTYFDTVTYIYSYAGDSAERFSDCSAEIADMLGEYHQLFDIYHEYSGINNLCTVNKMAGGEAVTVDARLMEFLLYAKELYELTGGEMNVMMGSVLTLWHNAREAASRRSEERPCSRGRRSRRGSEAHGHLPSGAGRGKQHRPYLGPACLHRRRRARQGATPPKWRRRRPKHSAARATCSTSAATSASSHAARRHRLEDRRARPEEP